MGVPCFELDPFQSRSMIRVCQPIMIQNSKSALLHLEPVQKIVILTCSEANMLPCSTLLQKINHHHHHQSLILLEPSLLLGLRKQLGLLMKKVFAWLVQEIFFIEKVL